MHKGRLEAFSDGVIAIIITIMVLELKVPHGHALADLVPLLPVFLSYVLSFIFVGIYWNNHHHMFQAVHRVSGGALWANLHLLFWLSVIPFVTSWMGEHHGEAAPVALYGGVLLACAIAYTILQLTLLKAHGRESVLARAIESGTKEKLSLALYLAAVPIAFASPVVSQLLFVTVAIIWLVPDRRIERVLADEHRAAGKA
ncbi:MAG: DUF1211 domain-containing protein [Gemmatimonadetes bacterium]|nr:DUF1211 domain-containing protein [Gemmatimonadota bacterium]